MYSKYKNKVCRISLLVCRRVYCLTIMFLIVSCSLGCRKLVEIDSPKTSINGKNVFSNDVSAISVLSGIYTWMSFPPLLSAGELSGVGYFTGLSSDELILNSGNEDDRLNFFQNKLISPVYRANFWNLIYPKIYSINTAVEGLSKSNTLTPVLKQQLLGEAKFMRAFFYFYLVNLYGDVPLVLTSDYTVNQSLSRTPKKLVWEQIIIDLKEAKTLLNENYLDGRLKQTTTERVRPTKWAAGALLARAYLYNNEWKNAQEESTSIIEFSALYRLEALNKVFLKNNNEAIWQLQPVNAWRNTADALSYVITEFGPNGSDGVYLSDQLMNTFEKGDQRQQNWTNTAVFEGKSYPFAYKYKVNILDESIISTAQLTEYNTVFRLAEQYLIRAESRAELGNQFGAIEDVDVIRKRAGLPLINNTNPGISKDDLIEVIFRERQHELFTEWGHRWFDLKRTQKIDKVMSIVVPLKLMGGVWNPNQQLYPLPPYDISQNKNLIQNPGY